MKRALLLSAAVVAAAGTFASAAPFVHPQTWTVSKPSEVKRGGTYRISRFGEESTINPFYSRVSGDIDDTISAGGLFTRDLVTRRWIPYMAESYTVSADKRTFTMKLRREMKWSDGKPIVADDWVLAARINKDEKFDTVNYDSYYINEKPIEVTRVDANTLRVTFPSVIGTALYQLAILDVQPAHVFGPIAEKGAATLKAAWSLSTPASEIVSSGSWKFAGYRAGERINFVRNPFYGEWNKDSAGNPLPYMDAMVSTIFKDQNAQFAAFLAGQTDAFAPRNADDLAQVTRAIQQNNLKAVVRANVSSAATGDRISFNFNRSSSPFKQNLFRNVAFRRAMSHLINRQAMIEIALGGLGTPFYSSVYPVLTQFQGPNQKKYDFNPEEARRLLASIGFTRRNADGWLVDSQNRVLEFDLSPNAGNTRRAAIAQVFSDEAKKIGVKVNVKPIDVGTWSDLLDATGPDRKFDAIMWGIVGGNEDLPYSPAIVGCDGALLAHNRSGKCIFPWETQIQSLLNRAERELDDDKRQQLVFQIQQIETENQMAIFTVSGNQHYAWLTRLKGELPQNLINALRGSRDTDLTWIDE